mmetsp:Transcript_8421/g.17476  ORF Transcript_8421/g.17476 Transcript_8421/m.17476 type:complete len:406 (-) Transcript_8421:52-1269(-)
MQVSFLFTALSTVRSSCKPHVNLSSSSVIYSRLQSPRNNPGFSFHQLYSSTSNNNIDGNNMSDFKRVKLDDSISDKVIGTHSGSFQADEAMGCFLLRQLPEYRLSRIVRSRDPKILETCDIVIDVGGVYDHDKLRYDHHQRGYDERFDDGKDGKGRCTKLSASGLVYRHYGKEVIKAHYPSLSSQHLELVYVKLYNSLLEALDAIDTGVEMSTGELVYNDSTGLSSRVGRLNPRWNEVNENGEAPDPDERFLQASDLCGQDFVSVMTKIVESDLPAREVVEKSVLERLKIDASGEIICFPSGGLPWKGHLYELEKQHKLDKLVKFVLYTDQGGMWRVQAVTVEGTLFENRLGLPEEWRGVRDEDLEKLTNIKGCRFVHAAGFIGGNTFYEGALEMARVALQQSSQ